MPATEGHSEPPGDLPRPDPPATWHERLELLTGDHRLPRAAATAAVVVAVVLAVLIAGRGGGPPPELDLPMAGGPGDVGTTTSTTGPLIVHAAGAVRQPGVYRMPPGARVADVLQAAGGPAEGADLDRLNLAAPVADGQQVYVPRVGEPVPLVLAGADGAGGPGGRAEPVDLNTATSAELEELPGIGPATARAILDERERRGRFDSVEDLLDVRGIGPAKLDAIRDLVRV